MDKIFFIAALVSMAGGVISLFWGLLAMAKGKKKDHQTSDKMMQLRVLFQGLAIILLFLAYLTKD